MKQLVNIITTSFCRKIQIVTQQHINLAEIILMAGLQIKILDWFQQKN
jgi:hypothetical protein